MDENKLRKKIRYEIDQADKNMLNYIAEAIAHYKKEPSTILEDSHPVLREALEISLAQAERGKTMSHSEVMDFIKTEYRFDK